MRIDIDGVSELGEIVMTEEFQPIAEKVDALLVSMAVTENKAIGALLLWLAVKLAQRDPDLDNERNPCWPVMELLGSLAEHLATQRKMRHGE